VWASARHTAATIGAVVCATATAAARARESLGTASSTSGFASNRIVLPAAATCAALSLTQGLQPNDTRLCIAGAALVAVLLVVSVASPATLGMGDVKLALLILCALNSLAVIALLVAVELYMLVAVALVIGRGRSALGTSLPLAPIIAAGCLITVLL
jgi:leader peptidase (prepilin peptidase)/N-methyltransferase